MMKLKYIGLVILVFISFSCKNNDQDKYSLSSIKKLKILESITKPEFPDRSFLLTDFGGIGDSVFDNKPAFDSIIRYCSKFGGGKIVIPSGIYLLNGPIHLKSYIHLYLEEGSKIIFGSNPEDYLPVVLTSWEGTRLYNYSPFIYTIGSRNIAITGNGEINGAASETWAKWKKLQNEDKRLCRKMNNEDVPLEQRVFGKDHYLRPPLIQFYDCENILIDGITIKDSPFWCLHTVYSNNITIRNLKYKATNYNNDGIDPESSSNVLIENITFNNNDDNIAIKAGRDREARMLNIPSENIIIRDCRFKGHNAIAIGSEMSGGVRNVFVEDCSYAGKVINGIYLKGNRDRGGEVRDIYVENLAFDTTKSVIIIDSNYKNQGSCCPPSFKKIFINKVKCNFANEYGISLNGYKELYIDSVFIQNVTINEATVPVEIRYVKDLEMKSVNINGKDFSNN